MGTLLLVVAAVPFLVNTWENERVVVWFTLGSFVAAILLEVYLSKVKQRHVPAKATAQRGSDS